MEAIKEATRLLVCVLWRKEQTGLELISWDTMSSKS